jgi:hypothetical protein
MNEMLGCRFRDAITGFEGVAVGHVQYITGCDQLLLVPGTDEKGQPRESHWIDVQRCRRVGDSRVQLDNGNTPGPDKPAPKR